MRNLMTFFALLLSVTGIAVSLAREEVRCYLGLSSESCQSNQESLSSPSNSTTQPLNTEKLERIKPSIPETVSTPEVTKQPTEPVESSPVPEQTPDSVESVAQPTPEPEPVSDNSHQQTPETSQPSTTEPNSQSVEIPVIPPPDDTSSQPDQENKTN